MGKRGDARRLDFVRKIAVNEQNSAFLPFRGVGRFFDYTRRRGSHSVARGNENFYIWETASSFQCPRGTGKKHRDSMPRREIGRQIDRRVVNPRRLDADAQTRSLISSSLAPRCF